MIRRPPGTITTKLERHELFLPQEEKPLGLVGQGCEGEWSGFLHPDLWKLSPEAALQGSARPTHPIMQHPGVQIIHTSDRSRSLAILGAYGGSWVSVPRNSP